MDNYLYIVVYLKEDLVTILSKKNMLLSIFHEETIVRIDYKQTGVGSASCGVKLAEKYQFKEKFFDFEFEVKPL